MADKPKVGLAHGHGGVLHDRGANGKINEYVVNELVVNHIKRLAKIDNLVEIIDCNVSPKFKFKKQDEDLAYKCKVANNNDCDIYVEVHHNAGGGTGTEVFAISNKGSKLARSILNEYINNMGFIDRGVKNKSFYVLRNTKDTVIACLVEGWFVDSTKDFERYEKYGAEVEGKCILNGIYNYFGIKKPTEYKEKEYIVKKGDTLYGISRKLGVTIDYLCEKNKISNKNLIAIGQKLKY